MNIHENNDRLDCRQDRLQASQGTQTKYSTTRGYQFGRTLAGHRVKCYFTRLINSVSTGFLADPDFKTPDPDPSIKKPMGSKLCFLSGFGVT